MRQPSPWLVWTGAALAVWILWGVAIAITVQRSLSDLAQKQQTLKSETAKAAALLADAPIVARRLDSLVTTLETTTQHFYALGDLQQLETAIQQAASAHNVTDISVTLELNSVLALKQLPPDDIPRLDTVHIECSARGDFQAIGRWLDDLEERVDFTQWRRLRWETGNETNTVGFAGAAAFWIVVNRWNTDEG